MMHVVVVSVHGGACCSCCGGEAYRGSFCECSRCAVLLCASAVATTYVVAAGISAQQRLHTLCNHVPRVIARYIVIIVRRVFHVRRQVAVVSMLGETMCIVR